MLGAGRENRDRLIYLISKNSSVPLFLSNSHKKNYVFWFVFLLQLLQHLFDHRPSMLPDLHPPVVLVRIKGPQ